MNTIEKKQGEQRDTPPESALPDLAAVHRDYTILDRLPIRPSGNGRVITHEDFSPTREMPDFLRYMPIANTRKNTLLSLFGHTISAWRLLRQTGRNDVLLVNGGATVGKLVGLFNSVLPIRRRKILMWEAFLEARSPSKWRLIRLMVKGCDLVVLYSQRQVRTHMEYLKLPEDKFIFLPYKANHSKREPTKIDVGKYIFSGGDSKRDYHTLIEAVRGTGIPVIISTTDRHLTAGLEIPTNVILVEAREPAFERLTAGGVFAVMAITAGNVRGAGETNVCNAMWHGKPVIVADDVSALEYVEEGTTGYTVKSGNIQMLRQRIIDLWSNPGRVAEMGRNAHHAVAENYTHLHFVTRLVRLAALLSV